MHPFATVACACVFKISGPRRAPPPNTPHENENDRKTEKQRAVGNGVAR